MKHNNEIEVIVERKARRQCRGSSVIALAILSTACLSENELEEEFEDVRELELLDDRDDDDPPDRIVQPQRTENGPDVCDPIDDQPGIPDELTANPDTAELGGRKCCNSVNGSLCVLGASCSSCTGIYDYYIECSEQPGCMNPACWSGWVEDPVWGWHCEGRHRYDVSPGCNGLSDWDGCEGEGC